MANLKEKCNDIISTMCRYIGVIIGWEIGKWLFF